MGRRQQPGHFLQHPLIWLWLSLSPDVVRHAHAKGKLKGLNYSLSSPEPQQSPNEVEVYRSFLYMHTTLVAIIPLAPTQNGTTCSGASTLRARYTTIATPRSRTPPDASLPMQSIMYQTL